MVEKAYHFHSFSIFSQDENRKLTPPPKFHRTVSTRHFSQRSCVKYRIRVYGTLKWVGIKSLCQQIWGQQSGRRSEESVNTHFLYCSTEQINIGFQFCPTQCDIQHPSSFTGNITNWRNHKNFFNTKNTEQVFKSRAALATPMM